MFTGCQPSISPSGQRLGPRFSPGWQPVMKVYLIPPGYEAKLRPSALLSYKGKRCSPLHKRTAGLFDSVASAPESFQNFLFLCVLPLEETPNPISVFVVVVQPLGATPRAHTLGHGIQSRQQTPLTDMGSLYSRHSVLCLITCLCLTQDLTQSLIL